MNLIPLFYSTIIVISALTSFFLSTQGMYVNRTFMNMPLSILESNVLDKRELGIDVSSSDTYYYFDKTNLKSKVIDYLSSNLKGRVDKYELGIKYYKYQNNEFIESNEAYLNAVKLRFKCIYYKSFFVDSSLSFYIKEEIK